MNTIIHRALLLTTFLASALHAATPAPPNLVVILADDLGFGDVSCFNPASKIATPHIDRLAREGIRFTDAHTASSVCTPTRYALLTGRYPWRTRVQKSVLGGFSPPLIAPGRLTLASLLQHQGYTTAAVGKWHLGMTWPTRDGVRFSDRIQGRENDAAEHMSQVDWQRSIPDGPLAFGFNSFFGIAASLDMPPYGFIRDDRIAPAPTMEKKWIRTGPATADFEAEDVLPALTRHAVDWLDRRARENKPFFLYLPLTSPHTPILPAGEFRGKSNLTAYGDFVIATDDAVGKVLDALERNGLTENTLVIVTSDNGCSPAADVKELLAKGHSPSGPWRGFKADIWEGGHRVPFVARWPARIRAGSTSDQTITLGDLVATAAEFTGTALPDDSAEDSVSFLPALLSNPAVTSPRTATVQHSIDGKFAVRQGNWKLAFCPGSGGWSHPRDEAAVAQGLPPVQLYNLAADPGETKNLALAQPERVAQLTAVMERIIADGRSTPGQPQRNDAPVNLFKKIVSDIPNPRDE